MGRIIKQSHMKSFSCIWVLALLLNTGVIPAVSAQTTNYNISTFQDGELLRYKVKWGIFRLGTVEISQQMSTIRFFPGYLVTIKAQSGNVPFIKVYSVSKGFLNPAAPTNKHFVNEKGKEDKSHTAYKYDPVNRSIYMESEKNGKQIKLRELPYEGDYYDPVGIIMMLRCLASSKTKVVLPTLVDFDVKGTELTFTDKVKFMLVPGARLAIKARRFEGRALWVGKDDSGIAGPFSGWVSDDDYSIPLKVKVNISLGSISLELIDVYRSDCKWSRNKPRKMELASEGGEK